MDLYLDYLDSIYIRADYQIDTIITQRCLRRTVSIACVLITVRRTRWAYAILYISKSIMIIFPLNVHLESLNEMESVCELCEELIKQVSESTTVLK